MRNLNIQKTKTKNKLLKKIKVLSSRKAVPEFHYAYRM